MKPIHYLLIAISLGCAGCSSTPLASDEIESSDLEVTLERLVLTDSSISDGVEVFRQEWAKALGRQAPPIVLVERERKDTESLGYESRMTCDIRGWTAAEILNSFHAMTSYKVEIRHKEIILRSPPPYIIEGWETMILPISEKGQQYLGIDESNDRHSLMKRVNELGVSLCEGCDIKWLSDTNKLVITAEPHEIGKLMGQLWLIDEGYIVRKLE